VHVPLFVAGEPQQTVRLVRLKLDVQLLDGVRSNILIGQLGQVVLDPRPAVEHQLLPGPRYQSRQDAPRVQRQIAHRKSSWNLDVVAECRR